MLDLSNVTLFCFENRDLVKSLELMRAMTQIAKFGDVRWLNDHKTLQEFQKIEFDLCKHMTTTHALTMHLDGFIINPESWNPDWLKYDYIGAPWPKGYLQQFNPQWVHEVGNSGFSLRSKRLSERCSIIRRGPGIVCDISICQTYRNAFEKLGLQYAPPSVAAKFSRELSTEHDAEKPFGFHGAWPLSTPAPSYYEPGICAKNQAQKVTLITLDGPQNDRTKFARSTWAGENVYVAGENNLPRLATEIGDELGVPFVPDVFDLSLALPGDIFAYINNDVALVRGWKDVMLPEVMKYGCAFSQRRDVKKFKLMTLAEINTTAPAYVGTDLFVFTKDWWNHHRNNFPVVPFAYEGWDAVMTYLMSVCGFRRTKIVCYHEAHTSWWSQTRKATHPAVKANRERQEEWAKKNNVEQFLGKNDGYIWNSGIFCFE